MAIRNNRYTTEIDFTQARFNRDASLVYTVLKHYNGSGTRKNLASDFIMDACKSYDPNEPEELTRIIDIANKTKHFISQYKIICRNDILKTLKTVPINDNCELLEPQKRFLSFDINDPDAVELWERLNAIRFRDRGIFIIKVVFQYLAKGNCDYYNDLCCKRWLRWLKSEYETIDVVGEQQFNAILDMMCAFLDNNGESENAGSSILTPEERENERRLREAMGML